MQFTLVGMPKVIFGPGRRMSVGEEAAVLGHRALLVSGTGSVQRAGHLRELTVRLAENGVEVELFSGVQPEPTVDAVEAGRQVLAQSGCDLVIGLGGGSVMDVAKAIGGLAGTADPVAEFVAGPEVKTTGLPIICLPTTSGTGAEVTRNSVLTNPDGQVKASVRGDSLTPTVAIVDPELTLSLPPEPTAASGLDALTQALEAFVSRNSSIVTDCLALKALEAISAGLQRAWENGDDLEARAQMSLGSLLAGMALASARLGLVHGMAHPLGLLYHLAHGWVCATLLPHVVRFNIPAAADKYAFAAEATKVGESAEDLLEWLEGLCGKLGAPMRIEGLNENDFDYIVKQTLGSGSTRANPREATETDVIAILRSLM